MKKLFLVFALLMYAGFASAGPPVPPAPPGSSGAVATDTIWAAAGDLVQGTGNDAAAVLTKGANGTFLQSGAVSNAFSAYTLPATVPTVGKVLISDGTNLIGSTALGTGAYATIANYAALAGTALSWGDGTGPVVHTYSVTGTDPTLTFTASLIKSNSVIEAPSFQMTKSDGIAGFASRYEANSTDLDFVGEIGPAAMTANTSYVGRDIAAAPTSANMVQAWDGSAAASGSGTPADFWVYTKSWVDLDTYALLAAPVFTTSIEAPYLILGTAATAADEGAIRLPNAAYIFAEADGAGTDISVIGVDSAEIIQIGASGASAVTITPNTTITGDLTVTGADITLLSSSAGAKITGGDRTVTLVGTAANAENLIVTLGNNDNTATVSSGTGVTDLSLSAINLATTGSIQGGIKISSDADGMTAANMTSAGMYGTMFIATGAGTWILPTAALGMSACLMDSGTAHDLILDVTSGDTMRLKGTEQADGVGITNASGTSTGDFICVICVATNKWSTVGMQGTWASQ